MAKFWYANSHYKNLLSTVVDSSNGDTISEVEINGETWLKIPSNCSASILASTTGLPDVYFSCDVMILNDGAEDWGVVGHEICYINGDSGYCSLFRRRGNGDVSLCVGSATNAEYPRDASFHLLFHATPDKIQLITSVANYGEDGHRGTIRGFSIQGLYVRNIIISEETLAFSDTIREVPISSIAGDNWRISDNSAYTEDTNVSATVNLSETSMKQQLASIDPRKLIFTGMSERQGENITGLDVKRGHEIHLQKIDVGTHVFGTAYDTSKDDANAVLTITTRSV